MFESYKEEVTFNEERGSEDFDPQNEFYQEDMEELFKKDITSIGRRLIVYMLVFFFFAAAGQQGAAQNAVDTEDFLRNLGSRPIYCGFSKFTCLVSFKKISNETYL